MGNLERCLFLFFLQGKIKTFIKSVDDRRDALSLRAGNGERLVLLPHVSDALKLVDWVCTTWAD